MLKYFALILQKTIKYNFTTFQNQIGIIQLARHIIINPPISWEDLNFLFR